MIIEAIPGGWEHAVCLHRLVAWELPQVQVLTLSLCQLLKPALGNLLPLWKVQSGWLIDGACLEFGA